VIPCKVVVKCLLVFGSVGCGVGVWVWVEGVLPWWEWDVVRDVARVFFF
jgi:hypothetical protein